MQPEVVGSLMLQTAGAARSGLGVGAAVAGRAADRLAAAGDLERPLGLLLARRHVGDLLALLQDLPVDRGLGAGRALLGLVEQAQFAVLVGGHRLQRGGAVQEPVGGRGVEQRGHRTEPTGPVGRAGELAERRAAGDELGFGLGDLRGESLLALHRGAELGPRVEEAPAGLVELVAELRGAALVVRRGMGGGGETEDQEGAAQENGEQRGPMSCRVGHGQCPSVSRRPG